MAKKNFSGGLDSLLGGAPLSNDKKSTPPPSKTPSTTSNKVIPSRDNLLSLLTEDQKQKIEKIASKEGRSKEDIIKEAIHFYLDFQVDL